MERLVAERIDRGPFTSLDDLASRCDPRLLNKRQVETLAAAGALDGLDPNRAGIFAAAETILAVAQRLHEQRTSGQGGLFGEGEPVSGASIKLPLSARWTLAQRMEEEKEAFGFYFSAHPVDRHRHLAKMHGARSFVALGELSVPDDGTRVGATMAFLVEEARWRTSARGKRFLMATVSDPSGQFVATCFDDPVSTALEDAARAGVCGIATVELDRRQGEETPRVSIRRFQPFDTLATSARMEMIVAVDDVVAVAGLAGLLAEARGARGEVHLIVTAGEGIEARLTLGRDFLLDDELASRIELLAGVTGVTLKTADMQRLALVG